MFKIGYIQKLNNFRKVFGFWFVHKYSIGSLSKVMKTKMIVSSNKINTKLNLCNSKLIKNFFVYRFMFNVVKTIYFFHPFIIPQNKPKIASCCIYYKGSI